MKIIFISKYSLEETEARLGKILISEIKVLSFNQQPGFYGKVKNNKVFMYKVRPNYGNVLMPIFKGRMLQEEGKVKLVGTVEPGSAAIFAFLLWFLFLFINWLLLDSHTLSSSKGAIVMLFAGLGVFYFCLRMGDTDSKEILKAITKTIEE